MAKKPKKPLVSVIIPTYNRGWIVKEAIDSVLEQDFSDYELIVVDDGSDDNTPAILKARRLPFCGNPTKASALQETTALQRPRAG
jgi:glycosyltransferase involved in cell wall biosynthesis